MAYDFVLEKDWSKFVEAIEFSEEEALYKLSKYNSSFIQKIQTYYYANAVYGIGEMVNYRKELINLFDKNLEKNEKALLYKLIAILSYAIENNESLTGLGD